MARRKKDTFSVTKAVKAASRANVGPVPPTRAVPDAKSVQKRRSTKHKQKLTDLISADE
jgi:hypothetical protein